MSNYVSCKACTKKNRTEIPNVTHVERQIMFKEILYYKFK